MSEDHPLTGAMFGGMMAGVLVGALAGLVFGYGVMATPFPDCLGTTQLDEGTLVRSFEFDEVDRLQGWVDTLKDQGWAPNVTAEPDGWRVEATCQPEPGHASDFFEG